MMDETRLCQYLDWDSDFFGLRIARVNASAVEAEQLKQIIAWSEDEKIDCLYFLAESNDNRSLQNLQHFGFQFVDVRITLERLVDQGPPVGHPSAIIRPARETDLSGLKAIARISHVDSRFYSDGRFPKDRCDALYETWIEKSCNGYAERVFVAEHEGMPAGYISCHVPSSNVGQIGIVGVGAEAQGRGLGQQLVGEALRWFKQRGVDRVLVVTQGRNIRAQRLYQRCGFVTQSLQLWYHKWFLR